VCSILSMRGSCNQIELFQHVDPLSLTRKRVHIKVTYAASATLLLTLRAASILPDGLQYVYKRMQISSPCPSIRVDGSDVTHSLLPSGRVSQRSSSRWVL
jgi:hypothetical protein